MRSVLKTAGSPPIEARIRLDPALRQAGRVAIVEQRYDLPFQQVVERDALQLILVVRIVVDAAVADRPADPGPVRLVPPAIERADVQRAVGDRLHAAGAARLHRPARRVQPDVDPLDHPARHADIVLLQDDDPAADLVAPAKARPGAKQLLAAVVGRVGLAAEDELNRPLRDRSPDGSGDPDRAAAASPACTRRSGAQSRSSAPSGPAPRPLGSTSDGPAFCRASCEARRARTQCTSSARSRSCRSQRSRAGASSIARNRAADSSEPVHASGLVMPSYRSVSSGASQVRRCTPLVTLPVGTSSSDRPGQTPPHSRRDSPPCSMLTPLLRAGQPKRQDRHRERLALVRRVAAARAP